MVVLCLLGYLLMSVCCVFWVIGFLVCCLLVGFRGGLDCR